MCSHGAGTLQAAGTGEEEVGGRMELPLGGQFRSTVWEEAVGKGEFTQPPLRSDERESALQALEG